MAPISGLVILLYGLPCVGKTAVADCIRRRYHLGFLQIDDIWERLFAEPTYSVKEGQEVFCEFKREVRDRLRRQENLIIEGVFFSRNRISQIERLCDEHGYRLRAVLLSASDQTIGLRLAARRKTATSEDISLTKVGWFRNRTNSKSMACVQVDTEGKTPEEVSDEICAALAADLESLNHAQS